MAGAAAQFVLCHPLPRGSASHLVNYESNMADLWQEARKQCANYERRSSELALALATEKAALEALQREVKKLEEGERRCCGLGRWGRV